MNYDFDDIEDYLHGQMSAEDKKAFEAALASDPELADDVEAQRAAAGVLRAMRVEALKQKMQVWEQDLAAKSKEAASLPPAAKMGQRYGLWLISALAGIVAVGIALWVRHRDNSPSPKENALSAPTTVPLPEKKDTALTVPPEKNNSSVKTLDKKNQGKKKYDDVYAVLKERPGFMDGDYKGVLMDAGGKIKTTDDYTKALQYYNAGQYKEALKLLEHPDAKYQEKSIFLRAYTQYHLQRYVQAEQDFRYFRTVEGFDSKADALWCEVFCMARQLPASRKRLDETLQEIIAAKPKHHYHKDAVQLQKVLQTHR